MLHSLPPARFSCPPSRPPQFFSFSHYSPPAPFPSPTSAQGIGCIYVATTAAANRWFVRKRGRVSVTLIAFFYSMMALPAGAQALIKAHGWRTTYQIMAAIVFVVLGSTLLVIRDHPGKMGLLPDGDGEVGQNMGEDKRVKMAKGAKRVTGGKDAVGEEGEKGGEGEKGEKSEKDAGATDGSGGGRGTEVDGMTAVAVDGDGGESATEAKRETGANGVAGGRERGTDTETGCREQGGGSRGEHCGEDDAKECGDDWKKNDDGNGDRDGVGGRTEEEEGDEESAVTNRFAPAVEPRSFTAWEAASTPIFWLMAMAIWVVELYWCACNYNIIFLRKVTAPLPPMSCPPTLHAHNPPTLHAHPSPMSCPPNLHAHNYTSLHTTP